ncbi:MAG TPA: M23 family metallopeptidase [Candidatus Binatia bacterium]|nr:M23 family metallopeptidase [Candidatus Binatia bacterium]
MRRGTWWPVAAAAIGLAAAAPALRALGRRRAAGEQVSALRAQASEQARIIARQRDEIARLGAAVDDLARVTAGARERLLVVRRLAHLADDGAAAAPPPVTRAQLASDAAMTLEQLGRVERNAELLSDSVAILGALVQERRLEAATAPSLWPVNGAVTSDFGPRRSPDGAGSETHPGLDIRARYGTPVAASGAGRVLFAGRDLGYGVLVILGHGRDVETLYGHLSAAYVHAGQQVRRGAVIGAVGATGRVTGPHLHFEVRVNGEPVDPRRYLARAGGGVMQVAARAASGDVEGLGAPSRIAGP